jgi:hypothetical protein
LLAQGIRPVHSRFPVARKRSFFFISLLCAASRQKAVAKMYNAQMATNQHAALTRIAVSRSGTGTISFGPEEAIGSNPIATLIPGANRLNSTRTPSSSEAETAATNRRALRVVVWFPFDTCLPDSSCALSSRSFLLCDAERHVLLEGLRRAAEAILTNTNRILALADSGTRRIGMNRVSTCI